MPLPKLKASHHSALQDPSRPHSPTSASPDAARPLRLPALLNAALRLKATGALPDLQSRFRGSSTPQLELPSRLYEPAPGPAPRLPSGRADASGYGISPVDAAAQKLMRACSHPLAGAPGTAPEGDEAAGASARHDGAAVGGKSAAAPVLPTHASAAPAAPSAGAAVLDSATVSGVTARLSLGSLSAACMSAPGATRRAASKDISEECEAAGVAEAAPPAKADGHAASHAAAAGARKGQGQEHGHGHGHGHEHGHGHGQGHGHGHGHGHGRGGDAGEAGAAAAPAAAASAAGEPILCAASPAAPPEMQRPVWRLDDYEFLARVYKGPISSVYKARCQRSGATVALKVYSLDDSPAAEHLVFMFSREIRIHSALAHPHIAALYGAFQEGCFLVLVEEWAARGNLHGLLRASGRALRSEAAARRILRPFLAALAHMHARGICHRDIKPENILFTSDWQLKLADFGVSIDLTRERAVTRTGTLDYMAPEVSRCPIKGHANDNKDRLDIAYSFAADLWSVGILAYELLMGFPPFRGGVASAAAALAAGMAAPQGPGSYAGAGAGAAGVHCAAEPSLRLLLPPPLPSSLSAGARDFISFMLTADPLDRPTALQLLRHPWITGAAQ